MTDRKRIKVDAFYDLETEDWTTFVMGALWRPGQINTFGRRKSVKDSPEHLREQDALAEAILAVEGDVWAHNGGRFDTLWLADRLAKLGHKFQMVLAGSTIVCLRAGKTRVFDSFALTKLSAKDLTAGLDVRKEALGLPCVCGAKCGGYCSIKTGRMTQANWDRCEQYMIKDCESVVAALARLQDFADANDLDLSSTTGGAAWKTISRWLGLPKNDLEAPDWKFSRDAYFGGRVFYGKRRSKAGRQYDVNSMYPSALANGSFPSGELINSGGDRGKTAERHWRSGKPGIFQALVTVPESHIPPLPIRSKQGRVCYPWGTFRGRWARPELEYAQSLGVTIKIERSLVWSKAEKIYGPWAERLFKIRVDAPGGKSGPLGSFVKFQLNAPSGKLGSKAEHDTIYCNPEDPTGCACSGRCLDGDARGCPCKGRCERGCLGECGAYVPLDQNEIFWRKSTWRIDDCSRPHHAAYLTALSRVEWHRQAVAIDNGLDVVYGDTDSIFCEKPRTRNIGKDLGLWADEGPWRHMIVIAPKVYRLEAKGEFKVKAKGIRSATADQIVPGPSGMTAALDSGQKIKGPKSGLRAGELFVRATAARRLSWGTGDRFLIDEINTRPPHITEIETAAHHRNRVAILKIHCAHCGREFKSEARARGGRPPVYCSPRCRLKYHRRGARQSREHRICGWCGQPFQVSSGLGPAPKRCNGCRGV